MITILSTAASVRTKLRQMFSPRTHGQRRVVLVAYVGRDACNLLPDFRDVELYCWPQIGATDPYALAELQRSPYHARVRLVDHLHTKLYWVEGVGFVVTSANLSRRALGGSIQEEFGVFSDETDLVPIQEIVGRLKSRPLRHQELEQLQKQHDEYWARVPRTSRPPLRRRSPTFMEWYDGDRLPTWKLGWWSEDWDPSPSTVQVSRELHGITAVHDYIPCLRGQLRASDWVLCFKLTDRGSVLAPSWLRVDFVNQLSAAEVKETGYTDEAVQLRPVGSEHRVPFRISLPVLHASIAAFGLERIRAARDLRPNEKLLTLLSRESKRRAQ